MFTFLKVAGKFTGKVRFLFRVSVAFEYYNIFSNCCSLLQVKSHLQHQHINIVMRCVSVKGCIKV